MSTTENLVQVSGSNLVYVYGVLGISLIALAIAWGLRAQVLANDEGTEKMKEIAGAVQEGAAAYLNRQFKTLSYFVAIVFVVLFALPGAADIRIGRSIFFLVGAGFSAFVGYNGMWLAVRANVRVAEPRSVAQMTKDGIVMKAKAPVFGPFLTYAGLACKYWDHSASKKPSMKKILTSPVIVIGVNKDPATPYAWSQKLAAIFSGSTLITFNGEGHTGHNRGSKCVDSRVDSYLLGGGTGSNLTC